MSSETTYTDYVANSSLSSTKANFAGRNFLTVLILHPSFFTWQSLLVVYCLAQTYRRNVIIPISISETSNFCCINFADNNQRWITLSFVIEQNFPIPFNPGTTIRWQMPQAGLVTLKIYDVLGREMTTLVNEELSAGKHVTVFDASRLSSGIYFYQIKAGNFIQTKKMILMK